MSTTTFRHNHPPVSFPRRNIGTSATTITAMTSDRSRSSAQKNIRPEPIPPIRESLSANSINKKPSPTTPLPHSLSVESPTTKTRDRSKTNTTDKAADSPVANARGRSKTNTVEKAADSPVASARGRSNTNTSVRLSIESSKQTYTFSNKPRELPSNTKHLHSNRLPQRVLSAPDENSPRLLLDQPKPLSADGSLTPRSSEGNNYHSNKSIHSTKRDEQQKNSLNVLMKEQKRSKMPATVQKRRIILLFRGLSPRQEQNPSPILQSSSTPINTTGNISPRNLNVFQSLQNDSLNNAEPEVADSMQLAVILAGIQSSKDWNSNSTSPQQQQTPVDLERYNYVVSNPLDATFRLSPRTLTPNEEIAARSRFSLYYREEIQSSANARIPPLMASVVVENNNNTIGNSTGNETTYTFRVNPIHTTRNESSVESDESTMDNEQIQLCYDATLNVFYDPKTRNYYDLLTD